MLMRLSMCALVAFLANPVLHAETGAITGSVVNHTTQERLPSANVLVLGTQTGAATDVDGNFIIGNLPVGTYQLKVTLVGYEPLIKSDIVVASGRNDEVLIELMQASVDLEVVEVTARYFRKDAETPVSTQQLSYEEIRRSPGGFEDVIRAISVLPGVAQAQPGRNDLVVRGGAPSENLYVVDNVEVPNINHYGTQGSGGGPLSYVDLDFIRETSFSTGGFGVRYGDRLSSVLTIEMKDGRKDRLGGKATISATQFGLNLQGPVTEKGTFVFSARRSYLDFIFKAAGFSFVPEYYDFLGRATYDLDRSNSLRIIGIGAIDDVTFLNNTADQRYKNSRILGTAEHQYMAGFSWRHLFGNGYTTVTLGRSSVRYNSVQRDSLLVPIFTNVSSEGETGLRGDVVLQVARPTELSFGVQAKRMDFTTDLALPDFRTTFGDSINIPTLNVGTTGAKASGYLQVSQRIAERLMVVGGLRGDYFGLVDTKWYVAPRGAVTYEFSDLTSASVSAGTYYQSPSTIWLVSDPANRSLLASRADQYIIGVEHLLQADLKGRIEVFLKKYSHYVASSARQYLVLANVGGGYGGSTENFDSYGLGPLVSKGTGESRGVEFLLQKKLSDIPLYGLVSVTVSASRFRALDGVERPGDYDQRLIINLSGGYRLDERWEFSAKFRYAQGQPYTPFNPDGSQNVAAYNSLRVKANHSLDARVDRRWNFSGWNLIAFVDIQNVYNNKSSGAVRWDAREQKVEDVNDGIGILPSIGVSAEF